MQFRGHSLPVHQSMSVSWAFTLSYFVSQICRRDFFRLLAIGMCHFLQVHHFGIACLAGSKVNIQHLSISIIHPRCIKEVFSDATVFIAYFGLFLRHIGSDSNPGMTLEEPSRLRDRDVLRSCLYQSKEKFKFQP